MFVKNGDRRLSVWVDADYANKDNDGRSVSGVAVMVGSTVVNASSTILLVSEAEYVAMAQGAKTALFTKAVLDFLSVLREREKNIIYNNRSGLNHTR